ncbi:MAG: SDR family NAD(P)-dependent oxidoreductase [Acidimicrobiales bacterium]
MTGGSSGIGAAASGQLSAEGGAVVILDRQAPNPGRVPGGIEWIACDVRDEASVRGAVHAAAEVLKGPPDVAVNAAGIYRIAALTELESEEWAEVIATNLTGTFYISKEVGRALVAARRPGAVVTIASTAALVADPTEPTAHYNASKAGVLALTRQMAAEWGPLGIRVNAVCPGVIDTPMLRLTDDPATAEAYLGSAVPLRRLGRAEEVASAIVWLASPDAAYVTGVGLPVDGGVTAL